MEYAYIYIYIYIYSTYMKKEAMNLKEQEEVNQQKRWKK